MTLGQRHGELPAVRLDWLDFSRYAKTWWWIFRPSDSRPPSANRRFVQQAVEGQSRRPYPVWLRLSYQIARLTPKFLRELVDPDNGGRQCAHS